MTTVTVTVKDNRHTLFNRNEQYIKTSESDISSLQCIIYRITSVSNSIHKIITTIITIISQ